MDQSDGSHTVCSICILIATPQFLEIYVYFVNLILVDNTNGTVGAPILSVRRDSAN